MLGLEKDAATFVEQFHKRYFAHRNIEGVLEMLEDAVCWVGLGAALATGKQAVSSLLWQEYGAFPACYLPDDVTYGTTAFSQTLCGVHGTLRLRETQPCDLQEHITLTFSTMVQKSALGLRLLQVNLAVQPLQNRTALVAPVYTSTGIASQWLALERRAEELAEKRLHLDMLTEQIPVGIIQHCGAPDFQLLQYTKGFLTMFGYTQREVETLLKSSLLALIHPDDLEKVRSETEAQIQDGDLWQMEYRGIRKDGEIIRISERGRMFTTDDGQQLFSCILSDVTEIHNAQEQLRLGLERYQIIIDQTESIIFEWDIIEDTVLCSPQWEKKFGIPPVCTGQAFRSVEHIHPEDVFLFQALICKIKNGIPYCEAEFRCEVHNGNYIWCRARVSLQTDRHNRPLKLVGVIIDIDREKRETQLLQDRAERDSLTGLYNKGAVQSLIEQYLDFYDSKSVLLIIDVDNFKQVNDRLGHLSGDVLLTSIADILQKQFRSMDIIGRIGGDEFIVLLRGVTDEAVAVRKSEQVLEEMHLLKQHIPCEISCSIGIAMSPRDGTDYYTLFRNADIALYTAKLRGKDMYAFYSALDCTAVNELPHRHDEHPPAVERSRVTANNRLFEYLFHTLYETDDIERLLPQILEIIGKRLEVSRIFVFEESAGGQSLTLSYEWCDEGIVSRKAICSEIDLTAMPNYYQRFDERGYFVCQNTEHFPERMLAWASTYHISATLQYIIWERKHPRGFIGFDDCQERVAWTPEQVESISFLAEVISVFLRGHRSYQTVSRTLACMELILDYQKCLIYVIEKKGFRLFYANKRAREKMSDYSREHDCYRAWLNRDSPCENCPIEQMRLLGQEVAENVSVAHFGSGGMAMIQQIDWPGMGEAYLVTQQDIDKTCGIFPPSGPHTAYFL